MSTASSNSSIFLQLLSRRKKFASAFILCALLQLQCQFISDSGDDPSIPIGTTTVIFGAVTPVNENSAKIEWDARGRPDDESILYRADSTGVFTKYLTVPAGAPRNFVDQHLKPGQGMYRYIAAITRNGTYSPIIDTLKLQFGPTFKWLNHFGADYMQGRSVIAPDNRTIYATGEYGIRVYDIVSGRLLRKIGDAGVLAMMLLYDGTTLATMERDTLNGCWLKLWNPRAGTLTNSVRIGDGRLWNYAMAVPSSGAFVAYASLDSTIQIRRLPDFALVNTIKNNGKFIEKILFSPDNSMIMVLNWDVGTITFYDVASGKVVRTVDRTILHASSMTLTKDGTGLVVCSSLDGMTAILHYPSMSIERTIAGETYQIDNGNNGLIFIYSLGILNVVSRTDPAYSQRFYSRNAQGFSIAADGSRIAIIYRTSIAILSTDIESAWHRVR